MSIDALIYLDWFGGFLFWPLYRWTGGRDPRRSKLLRRVFLCQLVFYAAAIPYIAYAFLAGYSEAFITLALMYYGGFLFIVASLIVLGVTRKREVATPDSPTPDAHPVPR